LIDDELPAEVFRPGEFIRRALEARGWSQADLAEITQRPLQVINEIIAGKRGITTDTAWGLSQALGNSAVYWLDQQARYDLSRGKQPAGDVALRAKIFTKGPVKEMLKRGWLRSAADAQALEEDAKRFFGLSSIDDVAHFWDYAARMPLPYEEQPPPNLTTWLFASLHVAETVSVRSDYAPQKLERALAELSRLVRQPEDVVHVPAVLLDAGIRLVIVEHLPQTRIDGACFWIDNRWPVISMSLRFDRIDYFWHTLEHELGHVAAQDGRANERRPVDRDLVGQQAMATELKPEFEQAADRFAVERLVPQDALREFIGRWRPLYSRTRILDFSRRVGVHPGIVVGQLQFRREIEYSHSRDLLVKIRDLVTSAAPTDGWGKKPLSQGG
jgi:HTH-type transcriptional regulator/antitoxin HigA